MVTPTDNSQSRKRHQDVHPMFVGQRQQIAERAAKQSAAPIYEWIFFVQSGGLVSHGANVLDVCDRPAAAYRRR